MEKIPEVEKVINWFELEDEKVKIELKKIVREISMFDPRIRAMTTDDVAEEIKQKIRLSNFPTEVSLSVSEPNEIGQRMVMGITNSPKTGEAINF